MINNVSQCLKVHKRENFSGSDFEFFTFLCLVIPTYYFLEIFFFIGPILEKLHSFRVYSVYAERGFSFKLGEKFLFNKNSNMTLFNFVKIVFLNFFI
jgi:hypothetical protein